jgi:hypothetical protein
LALASRSKHIIGATLIVVLLWLSVLASYVFFYPDYIMRLALDAIAVSLFIYLWKRTPGPIKTLYRDLGYLHIVYVLIMLFTPIARVASGAPVIFETEEKSEFYLVAAASDGVFVLVLAYLSVYAVGKTALDLRSSWNNIKAAASIFRKTLASERLEWRANAKKAAPTRFKNNTVPHQFRTSLVRVFPKTRVLAKAFREARLTLVKPTAGKTDS